MKIMQINDVHLSDQPPRMRAASYLDDVLDKLRAAMEMAVDYAVAEVVITGDLFHRKNASHTSHRTVQLVRGLLQEHDLPVTIVAGNHDQPRGGGGITGQPIASVDSAVTDVVSMPLAVHFAAGLQDGGAMWLPWHNAMEGPDGIGYIVAAIESQGTPSAVFAHAPVTLEPYPFGPDALGWIDAHELAEALPRSVRLFAHGHMHKGHAVEIINGVTFSNPGALARATIGTDDFDRVPQVAIIEQGTGEAGERHLWTVEYIEVPHRPPAEVYRMATADAEASRAGGIDALAQSLAGADTHVVNSGTLLDLIGNAARPDDVDENDWRQGVALAAAAVEDTDG
tara:strand:- start:293 stop:1312 length:1020 start_codon:yes stop_codon:yes gene_type:complete